MKRVKWVDSVRFLAIFLIMITHYLASFFPSALSLWEPGPFFWLFGGVTGKLSVAVFCVLLGYYACTPKSFSFSGFGLYTVRRYFQLAFFAFLATLLFLLGGYAVTWLFHTPDEAVFRILSDGPRYNLMYLLRDAFLLEDHYIDTLWCMQDLMLASVVCRLFGYLPERIRPGVRAVLACALITLLLVVNAAFFIWTCVGLMGCLVRLAVEAARTRPQLTAPVPCLFLLAVSLVLLKLPLSEGPLLYFLEGVIGFVWIFLIFFSDGAQRFLSHPPLPQLGKLSLGLFVIHTPVYSLLASSLIPPLQRHLSDASAAALFFIPAAALSLLGARLLHGAYNAVLRIRRREPVSAR